MNKKTNQTPSGDTIFVATGDLALPTGSLTTATTALNLTNGQVGIMSYDINSTVKPVGQYLVAGDDSNEVNAIRIVRGTPKSAMTQKVSLWEEGDLAYQQSDTIRRGQVQSVSVKKATFGKLGGQVASNFLQPVDNGEYGVYLTLDSVKTDKAYSSNNDVMFVSAPITDFTAQAITNKRSFVLEHLATQLNSDSSVVSRNGLKGNKDFVVFGIKLGAGTGPALSTITPTTNIAFDRRNGVDQTIQLGEAGVTALAQLVHTDANLLPTSTIEKLDITTVGATDKIDAIIVLGLPHELTSVIDEEKKRMVTPVLNFTDSFRLTATKPVISISHAEDAVNTGLSWLNTWKQRAGLMVHTRQYRPMGDYFNEGLSYINPDKRYTSYIINFFDTENTLTTNQTTQKMATILLPSEKLAAFVVNVANVVTRIAASQTAIPFVTSNDAGTGTASVNTVAGLEAVLSAWLEHSRTTSVNFTVTGDAIAGGVYLS